MRLPMKASDCFKRVSSRKENVSRLLNLKSLREARQGAGQLAGLDLEQARSSPRPRSKMNSFSLMKVEDRGQVGLGYASVSCRADRAEHRGVGRRNPLHWHSCDLHCMLRRSSRN